MRLWMIFLILGIVFFSIWIISYAAMMNAPQIASMLTIPMIICGWGGGLFIILFIVMLILKR